MSDVKSTKNKIQSKLEAIKKINDDPKAFTDSIDEKYLKDLPSTDAILGKKLSAYLDKQKRKTSNSNKDIFGDLLDISNGFLGQNKNAGKDKSALGVLKDSAHTAAKKTLSSTRQIVSDNVNKVFFAGDGICGTLTSINIDQLTLTPNEFDLLKMFTVEPSSASGKIMYEASSPDKGKQKVNRNFYNSFNGSPYQFNTNNNKTLFTSTWSAPNQHFVISGLTQENTQPKVGEFFSDYFSTIELPELRDIVKTAMLMTIQGDGTEPSFFLDAMNEVQRIIKKLLSVCGPPLNPKHFTNHNPTKLFNENDEDIQSYFNFDDVEGIDIDDEDTKKRRVLKFKDCNNFEVPVNGKMIEDFVYFIDKKPIGSVIDSTFSKVANDASSQSESSLPTINFNINLQNLYILNVPKAMITAILSPKIFFPIVLVYKIIKNNLASIDLKILMKKLWKLFYGIIKDIFWLFMREFWKLIKVELLKFLQKTAKKILKGKLKKYYIIITALIAFLTKVLQDGLDNCYDLFNAVIAGINGALTANGPIKIPNLLLMFADKQSGYSPERASMNISEKMSSAGINMGPIFGESNNLQTMIKSIMDGHAEEKDANGFVSSTNSLPIIVATPLGPGTILPGMMTLAGKSL